MNNKQTTKIKMQGKIEYIKKANVPLHSSL
jgi:hypothetical protein